MRARYPAFLSSVVIALSGCAMPKELPGELVGAYHIDGALTENSCGSDALPAADPLSFDVQIREDDKGGGLWLSGAPPARSGKLDEAGAFSFALETTFDAKAMTGEPIESIYETDPEALADPDLIENLQANSQRACRLLIGESIHGQLLRVARKADAGSDDEHVSDKRAATERGEDLVGENEITIRAQSGSDCKRVLAAHGGPFLQLPCRAHYDLTGTLDDG